MIKNFLCGVLLGIANIIPGISGGTILVILGLFDKITEAISIIFSHKSKWKEKVNSGIFLLQVLVGTGIGLIVFAKLLNFLFKEFELQTISAFAGFILFSLPVLKKEEMKHDKFNYLFLLLGIIGIGLLAYFSPNTSSTIELEELLNKNLSIPYLLILILIGIIGGGTMIFPGVSGSMVLLVLGYYHLFKGYVAYVTTFNLKILIPLCFMGFGVLLGIVLSSKLTSFLLKKYKTNTMSFIFGLIIMSTIIIFPMEKDLYTISNIITSIITFILGGVLVNGLDKLKYKKHKKVEID